MKAQSVEIPRVLIAALRGGSGKTIVSIGIIAALTRLGKSISPFKKGPDYIDAGWLALAAGRPCHNLDPFLFPDSVVTGAFQYYSQKSDIAVIEGNRGLYDGLDVHGTTSTASLAKKIGAPVVLCLDCTKSTRTMAAVVLGCLHFDPSVKIAGIIVNRVAGSRHQRILRTSIEEHCGVPVIGAIPKLNPDDFPERHMGLIPTPEHALANFAIDSATRMAEAHIDLEKILSIAQEAAGNAISPAPSQVFSQKTETIYSLAGDSTDSPGIRIGIIKDSAFQFYYPENLEALEKAGAALVYISPLVDEKLPDVDGLYIGGGFPETHAAPLSENEKFREDVRRAADAGMPIYAECGGLMYLGESLVLDKTYPMAGVLPIVFGFSRKPQGHGYTIVNVNAENPYYPAGAEIKGHEFHYSRVLEWKGDEDSFVFSMKKGQGIINKKDGLCHKNVMATYTHIHSLGTMQWAESLVKAAGEYKRREF